MGSLSPSGLRIPQRDVRYRHVGSYVSETSITGVPLNTQISTSGISVEREKFTANGLPGGNLEHDVTRKISGIHVSVSHREAVLQQNKTPQQAATGVLSADAIGGMETITERKIFFLDSDRNKKSGFADWNIFDAAGTAVSAASGTTDTDITPNATFDGQ